LEVRGRKDWTWDSLITHKNIQKIKKTQFQYPLFGHKRVEISKNSEKNTLGLNKDWNLH